jgi:membrane protein YqaA with SNARE-associated domain
LQPADWINYLLQFRYAGVFLVSFIGTASIIIPIPYTLVILWLSTRPGWDPILLTVAAGLGSGIGEFSGYLLGYYGRSAISEERRRKMDFMLKVFNRFGPLAIFLFALTPLPDDLLFIPLGVLRYNFVRAFIPSIIGKLLMASILAYGGQLYGDLLSIIFGESGLVGTIATSAITTVLLIILLVAMFKIDWEKLFERYVSQGSEDVEGNR